MKNKSRDVNDYYICFILGYDEKLEASRNKAQAFPNSRSACSVIWVTRAPSFEIRNS